MIHPGDRVLPQTIYSKQLASDRPIGLNQRLLTEATLCLGGSLLIAACAHLKIPAWPAPFTLQTFAVLLLGIALGPRRSVAAVSLYLAQGAVGIPVFAGGAGLSYFTGTTAGFLFGFVPAAALTGWIAHMNSSWVRLLAASFVGTLTIFAGGAIGLTLLGISPLTLEPYLLGAAIKIVALVAFVRIVRTSRSSDE